VIEVLLTVERLTAFRDALEVPDDADADDAAADADVEGSEEDDDDAAG
jgi:hypothetical protein